MKVTREQKAKLSMLEVRRKAALAAIEKATDDANEQISKAFGPVEAAIVKYNEIVSEFNEGLRDEIQADLADHIADKSDKWQESERGVAVIEMEQQWAEEFAEISVPDEPEIDVYLGEADGDGFDDENTYPREPGE